MKNYQNNTYKIQKDICIKMMSQKDGIDAELIKRSLNNLENDLLNKIEQQIKDIAIKNRVDNNFDIRELLKTSDIFRAIILPTTIIDINLDRSLFNSIFLDQWKDQLQEYLVMWLQMSLHDKVMDGGSVDTDLFYISEKLSKNLSWELKGHLEVIAQTYEKYKKTNFSRLADYVYALIDRYHNYGELINNSLSYFDPWINANTNNISYWLTNVLVISQLLDDVVDWEIDIENSVNNFLTCSIKQTMVDGDRSTYHVAMIQILQIFRYLDKHIERVRDLRNPNSAMNEISNSILDVFKREVDDAMDEYHALGKCK